MLAITILFSFLLLDGYRGAWAETIPTSISQPHGVGNKDCGRGSNPNPSGMTTIVATRPATPPSSPNRPSPAKPTSNTQGHLELRLNKSPSSHQERNLPSRRQAPAAPAAPPANPQAPPAAPGQPPLTQAPAPPSITPPPTLPKGPEYITDPAQMKAGVATYSGIDANGKPFRFVQATYYSCITREATAHCGWQRPILNVSYGSGAASSWKMMAGWGSGMGIAARAVGVACFVVGLLLARI